MIDGVHVPALEAELEELGLLLNLAARRLAAEDSDRDEPIHGEFLERIAATGFGALTNPKEEAKPQPKGETK